jgi:hypothetical protein
MKILVASLRPATKEMPVTKQYPQVADSLDDREQGSGFQHAVDMCDQFDAFALQVFPKFSFATQGSPVSGREPRRRELTQTIHSESECSMQLGS